MRLSFFDDTDPVLQVQKFLRVLFEREDFFEFRLLPSKRSIWQTLAEVDEQFIASLERENQAGQHIFIGVNPRIGIGQRGDDSVTLARALFADVDANQGGGDPAAIIRRAADAGLPDPSMVVNSGHGTWLYWRLVTAITDLGAWTAMEARIIQALHADPACKNPERLARLPGMMNWKLPTAQAHIVEVDTDHRAEWAAFDVLPMLTTPKSTAAARPIIATSSDSLLLRGRAYISRIMPAPNGQRNNQVLSVAGNLAALTGDHGERLIESEIVALLTGFNILSRTPLPDSEILSTVRSALKNGTPREPKLPRSPIHRQLALRGREVHYAH